MSNLNNLENNLEIYDRITFSQSTLIPQRSHLFSLKPIGVAWQKTRNLALIALASYKPQKFSLRKIPIKFWTVLMSINYQAAILFLYKKPITEIFLETEEILQESAS